MVDRNQYRPDDHGVTQGPPHNRPLASKANPFDHDPNSTRPKGRWGDMLSPEERLHRARERSKHHRRGMGGICREYYLAEAEQALAEEQPELDLEEILALVQEWLRTEDESLH